MTQLPYYDHKQRKLYVKVRLDGIWKLVFYSTNNFKTGFLQYK